MKINGKTIKSFKNGLLITDLDQKICPFDLTKDAPVKTWSRALDDDFNTGDIGSQDVIDQIVGCMPPRQWSRHVLQMGEPYSTSQGQWTYLTFICFLGFWFYQGDLSTKDAELMGKKASAITGEILEYSIKQVEGV